MKDKNSGKTRGFGYVTFKDSLVVQNILSQPHIFIDGKKVECKIAVPKDQLDKSSLTKIIEMLNEGAINNIQELKKQEKNKSYVYPNKIFVGGLPLNLSKGKNKFFFTLLYFTFTLL
jgi:RNA recognition motif-containing protein